MKMAQDTKYNNGITSCVHALELILITIGCEVYNEVGCHGVVHTRAAKEVDANERQDQTN